jgi:hypothetical protein
MICAHEGHATARNRVAAELWRIARQNIRSRLGVDAFLVGTVVERCNGQAVIDALEERGFFLIPKRCWVRFAALHKARRTTDLVILDWLYDAATAVPLGTRPDLSCL